jgi:hypothetical protein
MALLATLKRALALVAATLMRVNADAPVSEYEGRVGL